MLPLSCYYFYYSKQVIDCIAGGYQDVEENSQSRFSPGDGAAI